MRDLERLNEATHISAEAVENALLPINAVLEEARADQERLTAAVEKYGFTIDELGPAMRQQELHAQAMELLSDWHVLVDAGIDVALVNERMGMATADYLQTAIRTGAEVPIAFEPILRQMAEAGVLVDSNGLAIERLEDANINWARTMGQEFDRLIAKLEDLFERVFGVSDAIADIPREIRLDVVVDEEPLRLGPRGVVPDRDFPPATNDQGVPIGRNTVTTSDVAGFAVGTGGRYVDFGAGTTAVLHGRERIMTEEEGRREEAEMVAPVMVHNVFHINTLSSQGFRETIRTEVTPMVVDAALRFNVKGSRGKLRRGTKGRADA
jgi:hypothetical protein